MHGIKCMQPDTTHGWWDVREVVAWWERTMDLFALAEREGLAVAHCEESAYHFMRLHDMMEEAQQAGGKVPAVDFEYHRTQLLQVIQKKRQAEKTRQAEERVAELRQAEEARVAEMRQAEEAACSFSRARRARRLPMWLMLVAMFMWLMQLGTAALTAHLRRAVVAMADAELADFENGSDAFKNGPDGSDNSADFANDPGDFETGPAGSDNSAALLADSADFENGPDDFEGPTADAAHFLLEVVEEPAVAAADFMLEVVEEPAADAANFMLEVVEDRAADAANFLFEVVEDRAVDAANFLLEVAEEPAADAVDFMLEVVEEPAADAANFMLEVVEEPAADAANFMFEVAEEPAAGAADFMLEVVEEPAADAADFMLEVVEEPAADAADFMLEVVEEPAADAADFMLEVVEEPAADLAPPDAPLDDLDFGFATQPAGFAEPPDFPDDLDSAALDAALDDSADSERFSRGAFGWRLRDLSSGLHCRIRGAAAPALVRIRVLSGKLRDVSRASGYSSALHLPARGRRDLAAATGRPPGH